LHLYGEILPIDLPDLSLVIAGGSNGELYKWNYVTNELITNTLLHTKRVNYILRIPGTNYILTAGYDKLVLKIDVTTMLLIN